MPVTRPVSYSGGWTVMSYNNDARNSFLVHYSPTSKYSIGYKTAYWHEKEYWLNAFNIIYLAKRINKKKLVSYGGVSTDWETRRLFISYNINAIKSKTVDGTFMQKARAGFTPYLAGYGKLHTWLMYELHHMPEDNKTLTSNIVIRFFKSTNLLELGLDENKNTTLNFI